MCSYRDDPYEAAREFSVVVLQYASAVALASVAVSLVASTILLTDRRGVYAKVSLVLAVIAAGTLRSIGAGLIGLIFFLTFASMIYYPTTMRWVNGPLLFGATVLTAAFLNMVAMQTTHPCAGTF